MQLPTHRAGRAPKPTPGSLDLDTPFEQFYDHGRGEPDRKLTREDLNSVIGTDRYLRKRDPYLVDHVTTGLRLLREAPEDSISRGDFARATVAQHGRYGTPPADPFHPAFQIQDAALKDDRTLALRVPPADLLHGAEASLKRAGYAVDDRVFRRTEDVLRAVERSDGALASRLEELARQGPMAREDVPEELQVALAPVAYGLGLGTWKLLGLLGIVGAGTYAATETRKALEKRDGARPTDPPTSAPPDRAERVTIPTPLPGPEVHTPPEIVDETPPQELPEPPQPLWGGDPSKTLDLDRFPGATELPEEIRKRLEVLPDDISEELIGAIIVLNSKGDAETRAFNDLISWKLKQAAEANDLNTIDRFGGNEAKEEYIPNKETSQLGSSRPDVSAVMETPEGERHTARINSVTTRKSGRMSSDESRRLANLSKNIRERSEVEKVPNLYEYLYAIPKMKGFPEEEVEKIVDDLVEFIMENIRDQRNRT